MGRTLSSYREKQWGHKEEQRECPESGVGMSAKIERTV